MGIADFQKRVFIFGAGASKNSGAPLMTDFLDQAEYLYRKHMTAGGYSPIHAKESFATVLDALNSMQSLHSKSNIDLDNVEDVFGAFEIAKLIRKLSSFPQDKIDGLYFATSFLIAHTLEHSCIFEYSDGADGLMPSGDHKKFMHKLMENSKPDATLFKNNIFVTFNYDVCLDAAIHYYKFEMDYGLHDDINMHAVRLLKLHGSINWAECTEPNCGKMFVINFNDYIPKLLNAIRTPHRKAPTHPLYFIKDYHEYKNHYRTCSCANAQRRYRPSVVPPTWNKTGFHSQISNVWRHAANAIGEAEYIYIIGYSLPETDVFFRLLYALGAESSTRLKKFLVINPDGSAKARFDKIVSHGRIHRYEFRQQTFSESIESIFDDE